MNASRLTAITAVVLALVAVGVFFYIRSRPSPAPVFTGEFDLEGQPVIGDPDAPITMIAFEDFKCPACRNFEEGVFPLIENDYIRSGQVKFHFINYPIPLGQDSFTAAVAAECAFAQSEDAFWDYKTILYRSQESEGRAWATPSKLEDLAQTYVPELDSSELRACIDEERYLDEVNADKEMGVVAGVQGTPTLFVNGQRLVDYLPQTVQAAIEGALAESE